MKSLNTKNLRLLFLMLPLCLIVACKKDGTSTGSKDKWLMAGLWTLQKFEYKQSDGSWGPDPHAQDMDHITFAFNADKSVVITRNSVAVRAHWEMSADYSQLTISGTSGATAVYTVTSFTQATLQMIPTDNSIERDTYTR